MKIRCELCKCLNLVREGKKNPSQTVWLALTRKFEMIRLRNEKSLASFCQEHRNPLRMSIDYKSVQNFIEEVFQIMERLTRQNKESLLKP